MKSAKKNGFIMLQVLTFVCLALIILGAGIGTGVHAVQNFRTSELKTQCDVIDRSLEKWSKMHKAIDESTITINSDGKINYLRRRLYPADLSELGEVQTMGYFATNIELSDFNYSTLDGGSKYRLEVMLPDGTIYRSPQSTK